MATTNFVQIENDAEIKQRLAAEPEVRTLVLGRDASLVADDSAQDIGLGEDPDQPSMVEHRQGADLALEHESRRVLQGLVGLDGDCGR